MPTEPKRICTYPGCNTLVLKGRCERHPYPKKKPDVSPWRQGYNAEWSRIRRHYLDHHIYCEYRVKCNGAKATEVDHIVPLRQGGTHAMDNLAAVCKRCHAYKTVTQDVQRHRGKFDGIRQTEEGTE